MEKDLTFEVKCRRCGKVSRMFFGTTETTRVLDFYRWFAQHSTFPIQKQCDCDNSSIMLHDLVSKKIIL